MTTAADREMARFAEEWCKKHGIKYGEYELKFKDGKIVNIRKQISMNREELI